MGQILLDIFAGGLYYMAIAYLFSLLLRNDIFIVPLYCFFYAVTVTGVLALYLPLYWWQMAGYAVAVTAIAYVAGVKAHRAENVFKFVPAEEEEVEEE